MKFAIEPAGPTSALGIPRSRAYRVLGILFVVTLLAWGLALALGSVAISGTELFRILLGGESGLNERVIMILRLPREVNAFTTGALLAMAGALIQVLLRNPLGDPYVLGISGGAAAFALVSMWLGVEGGWIDINAFIGAVLSMCLVFGLARSGRAWTPTRLLLTGVIVAAGWGAIITFVLAIAPESRLRGMLFWLMGDLSATGSIWPGIIILVAGLLTTLLLARDLNVLGRGELTAAALGVNVRTVRTYIYVASSLFTAVAVATAGSIGFVGLVIPHLLRLVGLADMRLLLPGAVFGGGSLVLLADTIARTAVAPRQLPVGVIMAFIGVPLFLYLLRSR